MTTKMIINDDKDEEEEGEEKGEKDNDMNW